MKVSKYFAQCDPIILKWSDRIFWLLDLSDPRRCYVAAKLSPRPSDSGRVHNISANLKHVAWFTFSLLLWMQLFWLSSNIKKFNSVPPILSNSLSFSYKIRTLNKENAVKVQLCKLYNEKYVIASTQITNTDIFVFIAVPVFKLSEP